MRTTMLEVKKVAETTETAAGPAHTDRSAHPANDNVERVVWRSLRTALPAGDATRVRYLRRRWQTARH